MKRGCSACGVCAAVYKFTFESFGLRIDGCGPSHSQH
jgi:hypothetical protein